MEQSVFGLHKLKSIGIRLAAGRSATMMRFFCDCDWGFTTPTRERK